jgi:AcrR family transcriptional regulator
MAADPQPTPPPRSRRERPAKPALSREAIVGAGLEILRREGLDGLSMRRVAQALDTGPASLYVYVANQQELKELLFDAAIAEIEVDPPDPERWREQFKATAHRMVELLAFTYPGLAQVAMEHIPTGENAMRMMDAMLGTLRAGGVPEQAAAYAGDLLSLYITGIAYEQYVHAQMDHSPDDHEYIQDLAAQFAGISRERYPNLALLGPLMTRGTDTERFELGIDVILNGLLHTPTEDRLSEQPWSGGGATG